jgi:hypothetical protein
MQPNPEATMNTQNSISPVAALIDSNAAAETPSPSSIPPAPQSGLVLLGTAAHSSSSTPSAPPCAEFWPRAEAAPTLRASQVLSVAADEIDWLHENTDDETDPACVQARATIEAWLNELSPEHQLAIALHHDPMPWPEKLPGHEEDSFALVLHLLCPSTERDMRCYTPEQLALRARRRLEIKLEREGTRSLPTLVRRARWLFSDALRAYAEARGRVASVVPETSSSFDIDALHCKAGQTFEREPVPSVAALTMPSTGADDVTAARGDPKWLALVRMRPPSRESLSSHREGTACS